jgi:hypothetical protein
MLGVPPLHPSDAVAQDDSGANTHKGYSEKVEKKIGDIEDLHVKDTN